MKCHQRSKCYNLSKHFQKSEPQTQVGPPPPSHFLHCCHVASPSSHWVAMSISIIDNCIGCIGVLMLELVYIKNIFHFFLLLPGGRGVGTRGPFGPSRWPKTTSPLQELEVGACRAPYLLVLNIPKDLEAPRNT